MDTSVRRQAGYFDWHSYLVVCLESFDIYIQVCMSFSSETIPNYFTLYVQKQLTML